FATYTRPNSGRDHIRLMPAWTGNRFDWHVLALSQDIRINNMLAGRLFLEASLDRLYSSLMLFCLATMLAIAVALIVARKLLQNLSNIITQPICNLAELMDQVSSDQDYNVRASLNTRDEIGTLAQGFNKMLAHIQKRDLALEEELAKRRQAENHLDYLAHFDNVTQLPNRHFFNDRLATAIDNAAHFNSKVCLLFIDLDNFKVVNDTLGHHIGDILLKDTADRLHQALRAGDIICRIGGDEFAIILENISDPKEAEIVAKKTIATMSKNFQVEDKEVFIGASIGISFYPNDATNISNLLRCADTAMYYAKAHGKNSFHYFTADMASTTFKHFTLGNSLRKALERNEFLLYYQPQAAIQSGRLCGFEALLRWQHPEMGMINPADFIPLAEDTGLIIPIGEWVLRTACQQAKAWQDTYHTDLTMSVNLSGRQLKEDDIVEKILLIVAESGVSPHLIKLELTESVLMERAETVIGKLEQLHSAGIGIAIDDFGTGYSSMAYLKRFPVSYLKIDRSFVQDIPGDTEDAAISRAIIAMAHSLKLTTIAEGVETEEQMAFLRDHGCHIAQGYLIGKPLLAEEAESQFVRPLPSPLLRNNI
ncbi:MAG TPA: EAL domain-containing protein, partial [Rhodocyclaceae bacterium]|nr:EAL domain-containing protein [Rhodocyclaceae bacterium]